MQKTQEIGLRYEDQAPQKGLRYGIIEVTTNCQLACPGCYMVRRNFLNNGEMTLDQAIKILDLCRDYIGDELETMDILGGEPLLWPHLKDYIKILLDRQIKPWVFTNMLAITPEMAKWLFDKKVHVTGKLNIANPSDSKQWELQAKMIGNGIGTVQKMIKAIDIFCQAGYCTPLFRLQNLIRRANIDFVPDYYRFCLEKGIGTDLELMASGEEIGPEYWELAPTPRMIATMIAQIQEVRREFGLEDAEVLMPHVFGSCPFYDKGLFFAVGGSIRSCSNSTVNLSHIDLSCPIKTAWESELLCNRRKLSQQTVGEPCRSCKKWDKCRGGCRATVEGMGDPFGGYSLCPVPYLNS